VSVFVSLVLTAASVLQTEQNNNASLSVCGTVQNFDARAHADPSEVSERSGNGVLFRHGTVVLV
jgi:hypothetical protein